MRSIVETITSNTKITENDIYNVLSDTEYLKSVPNGSENDNLGNLPSISPEE